MANDTAAVANSNASTISERNLLLIVSINKFVGILGLLLMPILVGGFIDGLGMGETKAGVLAMVEVYCLGAGPILVSLGLIRLQPGSLAVAGCSIAIIGQIISIFIEPYTGLLAGRAVAGFGMGLVSASAILTIATAFSNTERAAGLVYTIAYIASAGVYLATPYLAKLGQYQGALILTVVIMMLAIPLQRYLPHIHTGHKKQTDDKSSLPWRLIILLFTGEAILFIGLGTCWSFAERLGLNSGLTEKQVSFYLAWSSVATIAGATFMSWLGTRIGRGIPILGGIAISAIACFLMASTGLSWTYIPGLMIYQASVSFVIPYMLSTGAALDKQGRVATAVIGALVFFFGTGATAGGWIIETYSLSAVGFAVVGASIISIMILAVLITQMNKLDM